MDSFDSLDIIKDAQGQENLNLKKPRLKLIIDNLLPNAVKYQNLNKDKPFVKISSINSKDNFIITVEDNGLGIPHKLQEQMFSMFKRFHPRTAYGSGLGLYMIKKSTSIIKGEISFTDTGSGSLFTLQAPMI